MRVECVYTPAEVFMYAMFSARIDLNCPLTSGHLAETIELVSGHNNQLNCQTGCEVAAVGGRYGGRSTACCDIYAIYVSNLWDVTLSCHWNYFVFF